MWQRDVVKVLQGLQLVGRHIANSQGKLAISRLEQIQRHSQDALEKAGASKAYEAFSRFEPKPPKDPASATTGTGVATGPPGATGPSPAPTAAGGAAPNKAGGGEEGGGGARAGTTARGPGRRRDIKMKPLEAPAPPPSALPGLAPSRKGQLEPPPIPAPKLNGTAPGLKGEDTNHHKELKSQAIAKEAEGKASLEESESAYEEVERAVNPSRIREVPSTPLARVLGFGQLAVGLAFGAVAESVRRRAAAAAAGGAGGGGAGPLAAVEGEANYSALVSDANAERLAAALCKMRGAALKLGQMLSIQDEAVVPPPLAKALERVRRGADLMPTHQLLRQLEAELGEGWRGKFRVFDETPVAAASIGQVHQGVLRDGRRVALKIQYPGVADSIDSDLSNLKTLVTLTNILPPGLFIDEIIEVGKEELKAECDYRAELRNQRRFKALVEGDAGLAPHFAVPGVVPELSSQQVLTSEFVEGVPIDQALGFPQEVRNALARQVLTLTIKELFEWNFMQTDPNWGNFLYDHTTGRTALIDFGASRAYDQSFVDGYLTLVWSAAEQDTDTMLRVSQELGFLTGAESRAMVEAHTRSGLVVGEPFVSDAPFDFQGSQITRRLREYGDTFMKHRLTPPPREAYSLHRKLAGAFLMCIKLRAVIPCRDILKKTVDSYQFGDRKYIKNTTTSVAEQQQMMQVASSSSTKP